MNKKGVKQRTGSRKAQDGLENIALCVQCTLPSRSLHSSTALLTRPDAPATAAALKVSHPPALLLHLLPHRPHHPQTHHHQLQHTNSSSRSSNTSRFTSNSKMYRPQPVVDGSRDWPPVPVFPQLTQAIQHLSIPVASLGRSALVGNPSCTSFNWHNWHNLL
jgi:hypothetical protein